MVQKGKRPLLISDDTSFKKTSRLLFYMDAYCWALIKIYNSFPYYLKKYHILHVFWYDTISLEQIANEQGLKSV